MKIKVNNPETQSETFVQTFCKAARTSAGWSHDIECMAMIQQGLLGYHVLVLLLPEIGLKEINYWLYGIRCVGCMQKIAFVLQIGCSVIDKFC